MPDLAVARHFDRKVGALSNRFIREVRRALREHRATLADVVASVGIRNPALIPQIARELEDLGREVVRIQRPYKTDTQAIAKANVEKQVAQLSAVNLPAPSIDTIQAAANLVALGIGFDTSPAWIAVYYGGLVSEINRARDAGQGTDELSGRLFAERIDDRASVYRKIKNAAGVESDKMILGLATGTVGAYLAGLERVSEFEVLKQAIAAIDERTTDCCLRVHGQIVPLSADFHLTGTPRFADYLPRPPFHWRCRTATTLYHPAFEAVGATTEEIKTAARAEINARQITGRREEIHPADARSRRS